MRHLNNCLFFSVDFWSHRIQLNLFTLHIIYKSVYTLFWRWYRAKILGVNESSCEYDIFFVDHGDREWIGKSKVVPAWPDIISVSPSIRQSVFLCYVLTNSEYRESFSIRVWCVSGGVSFFLYDYDVKAFLVKCSFITFVSVTFSSDWMFIYKHHTKRYILLLQMQHDIISCCISLKF